MKHYRFTLSKVESHILMQTTYNTVLTLSFGDTKKDTEKRFYIGFSTFAGQCSMKTCAKLLRKSADKIEAMERKWRKEK